MTVQTSGNTASYSQSDQSNVDFAYNFVVMDADHMAVYVNDVLQSPANYTVAGVANPVGGTVTFNTGPAAGTTVRLVREVPIDQLVDYRPYDAFPAETHEAALDKLTMICQQLQEKVSRAILGSPGGNYDFQYQFDAAANRINDLLAFSPDGTKIINIESAEDKAYRWAETPEDQVVEVRGGQNRYSAYHWSVKAFNATTLPLNARGDIMVGDGTTSPATILPVGPDGAFLRSFVGSDPGAVPLGIGWDLVPEALPPTPPGSKMKILHVKADESGFELAQQYAVNLIHAREWQLDDESDGDTSAYFVPHYQNTAMRFESPDAKLRAAHMVGVPIQNHQDVSYKLELAGAIGIGESGLSGTHANFQITPYLYWTDGTPSGLNPAAGVAVTKELSVTKNEATAMVFDFPAMVPTGGTVHDVFASFKIRRIAAVGGTEWEGSVNFIVARLLPE